MIRSKVFYVWDEILIDQCNRLPAVVDRASLVHSLISAYGLINHIQVVRSKSASYKELREFHSELYLNHLKTFTEVDDEYMPSAQDEEYGFGYDCAPVSNMFNLVCDIAGGSITAAKCLLLGIADIAINWCGGWHHAQRFTAEGFCYVNDIVLAIETLRRKFSKVLYIDLDVHHGNGVQDAYNLSKSVFTLSIHKFEPGFYPGTGAVDDIGTLAGKGYSCNVPLQALYSDETLEYVFEKVFTPVYALFNPAAVVVQCGADALARDPHGGATLTERGYLSCVRRVLDKQIPTLLLGGGGYNHSNAARLWTALTALAAGVALDENIPEHDHWTSYGTDYTLSIQPTMARDTNNITCLDACVSTIIGNLEKYLGNGEKLNLDNVNNEPELKRGKTGLEVGIEHKVKTNDVQIRDSDKDKLKAETIKNEEKKMSILKNNATDTKSIEVDVYTFTDE